MSNNHRNIVKNESVIVEGFTRYAFSTDDEAEKINRLCDLYGVQLPTASAILHWFHSDRYPVWDWRAKESVQYDSKTYKNEITGWKAYVEFCRKVTEETGVDMRTLDRALYMYSVLNSA